MSTEVRSARRAHRFGRLFIYGSLFALAAFYLMPLWVMIVTSLKSLDEIYSGSFIGLPQGVTFEAWEKAWGQACIGTACDGLPLRIHRPEGAFFLWLWFPGLPITSAELYRRLKRRDVYVISGHHFFPGLEQDTPHRHECLRLSYAQPVERVRAGIAILAEEVRRAYDEGRRTA